MKRLVDIIGKIGLFLILLPVFLLYLIPIHLFHLVTGKGIKKVISE